MTDINSSQSFGHNSNISFGSKQLNVQTGHLAKQAGGSALISVGDTVILATATVSPDVKEGQDFFPLTVDYRERTYAAGRIPGGFFKRETRPREKEILTSRLVDRTIRPLFPEGFRNVVQINTIVLSCDQVNDTDIPSIIGASLALGLSSIPFTGPVAAVRVGQLNGNFVLNPTLAEQKESALDLVVAGNEKGILMVESGSNELSEEKILEALGLAQEEITRSCFEQSAFIKQYGKPKSDFVAPAKDAELVRLVEESAREKIRALVRIAEKAERESATSKMKSDTLAALAEKFPEQSAVINELIEEIMYHEARALILREKVRTDGRKWDQIRPITCQVKVLPRTHGSAVFTRGQTQALATVTLGTPDDKQVMDDLEGEYKERFLLHYNFPSFSTGETKPERSPGRREIGHGALARRALLPLLPAEESFPYTIRVVSDILESNGSSSMASVCGGSLALFDAGVPMKSPCSGIAMGLITGNLESNPDDFAILSDIMGMEDHLGDMDFKVAGTVNGITSLQMDLKVSGVSLAIMKRALEQARVGRLYILDKMQSYFGQPRIELSQFAPKMVITKIPVDKIGALIGPGGKNIRRIMELTLAQIDVEDDGKVFISGTDAPGVERAKGMVDAMVAEIEIGKTYTGKVTRLMNFGAFVEILPGKEGLVHISQLDIKRVEKVEDVVKEGDVITVKCVEIDMQGRVNLSRKALLPGGGDGEGGGDSSRSRRHPTEQRR